MHVPPTVRGLLPSLKHPCLPHNVKQSRSPAPALRPVSALHARVVSLLCRQVREVWARVIKCERGYRIEVYHVRVKSTWFMTTTHDCILREDSNISLWAARACVHRAAAARRPAGDGGAATRRPRCGAGCGGRVSLGGDFAPGRGRHPPRRSRR